MLPSLLLNYFGQAALLLNDPAWGGIAITVNATSGKKLEVAEAIAQSIKSRK